ncbi:MAG: hypothetical protein M3Y33_10340 [Actinomycetota bacterium]|nr:hypothetical protein [Actinomycetota bacterium]
MPVSDAEYRDIAGSLPPAVVSQYLAATGDWTLETRQPGIREIWRLAAPLESREPGSVRTRPRGRIMLPLATDFVDFGEHYRAALTALATVNDWSPLQLEREILATRADLLMVRLDQEESGDSIPLLQAEKTVEAIHKMLRAAALTAAAPNKKFRGGRLPAPVSAFLEDEVRLGHTQRGSFVFTVVARLDGPAGPAGPGHGQAPSGQAGQFSRRVMETLALGIQTARDLAEGRMTAALSDPAQWGLSAGLIESLENITEAIALRSVDLSFEWAVAEPRPQVGAEPVRLNHAHLGELAGIREDLLQRDQPSRRETLVGTVTSLSREEDSFSGEEAASVVISAKVRGRIRNVHVILSGRPHDLAIQAYRLQLPMVIAGDLIYARRSWRLEGNVELDEGALLRQIADARRANG